MNVPVHLFFEYFNEDESDIATRTTVASYNGADNIMHIEFMSEIPFQRFRVRVASMSCDRQLGLKRERSRIFGKVLLGKSNREVLLCGCLSWIK